MPAPADFEFKTALLVSAQTSVLDAIDAGAGPGVLVIFDELDNTLGTITLDDPSGTVDSAGKLTVTAASSTTATADGTAAWGEVRDSTGSFVVRAPVVQGATPVSGRIVLSAVSIITGASLTLVSMTVG